MIQPIAPKAFKRGWVYFIISLIFTMPAAHGDIGPADLKGTYGLIRPEFQDYALVYGEILLVSRNLQNYRFSKHYGPKVKEHGCMDLVPAYQHGVTLPNGHRMPGLIEREDCPQDFTSEWIQRLFPSHDGLVFTANGHSNDPVSGLKPRVIGKLLQRIAEASDADLSKHGEILEKDLADILSGQDEALPLSPEEREKQRSELKSKIDDQERKNLELREKKDLCKRKGDLDQFQKVKQDIKEIADEIDKMYKSMYQLNRPLKKPIAPKYSELAKILVEAMKECRKKSLDQKHWPEQALLAFFLKKFNSRDDIFELLSGMPELLTTVGQKTLKDREMRKAFRKDSWKKENLSFESKAESTEKVTPEALQTFIQDPGRGLFEIQERASKNKKTPPAVSYKTNVPHSSLGGGTHGDCGESLVRDALDLAVYIPPPMGLFDIESFQKNHPDLLLSNRVLEFYTTHKVLTTVGTDEIHRIWNEDAISQLNDADTEKNDQVHYSKGRAGHAPVCDMNAGIDNFIRVMDHLLFDRQKLKAAGRTSPITEAKTRAHKLDKLFEMLSSKNSVHLTWSVSGKDPDSGKYPRDKKQSHQIINDRDLDVALDIRIGKSEKEALSSSPVREFKFTAGHFAVTDLSQLRDPWRDSVLQDLMKENSETEKTIMPLSTLLVNSQTIDLIPKDKQLLSHFYALPLNSAQDQLNAFKKMAQSHLAKDLAPLALGIKKRLETTETGTLQELADAELENNHPFGNTTHALGGSGAVYTKMSSEVLKEKFGENAAKQMGITWAREMYGRDIAIGEPLVDKDGKTLTFLFGEPQVVTPGDAKDACLKLNPPDKRSDIERAFLARENKLHQLRVEYQADLQDRKPDTLSANEKKEFDHILRNYSIDGCYLGSREEWKVIEADFGRHEKRYVRQILKKLKGPYFGGEKFFSSSVYPRSDDTGNDNYKEVYTFDGTYGSVESDDLTGTHAARCFCSSAAAPAQ